MNVFVYGTLREPTRAREVLGHSDFGSDARLVGLQRAAGRYPTLVPGGETEGRVLELADGDLDALDWYEGVDRGLYVRVRIPSDEGRLWTYIGDPDALWVDDSWPGEGAFGARVRRYLETHDVEIKL